MERDRVQARVHDGVVTVMLTTPELEYAVGSAIWDALARRDGTAIRVDLTRPDVVVDAEVLGPSTLVGIVRRSWRDEQAGDQTSCDETPETSKDG